MACSRCWFACPCPAWTLKAPLVMWVVRYDKAEGFVLFTCGDWRCSFWWSFCRPCWGRSEVVPSHPPPAAVGCCLLYHLGFYLEPLNLKLVLTATSPLSSTRAEIEGKKRVNHFLIGWKCVTKEIIGYLCNQSLTTVSLHSHGEVQPGPCVVMIFQTGQNQV